MRNRWMLGAGTLALALLAGCAGGPRLVSGWTAGGIAVDARNPEWKGTYLTVADGRLDVAVSNDDAYLYVSLLTTDAQLLQDIRNRGLIVWVDGAGKKKKVLGIHYPLGLGPAGMPGFEGGMGGPGGRGGPGERTGDEGGRTMRPMRDRPSHPDSGLARDDSLLARRREERSRQAEIKIQEAGSGLLVPLSDLEGIRLASDLSSGRFSYEMRIPLREDDRDPYAVGAGPGARIAVGIESPAMERPGGGGMRMGGMGGMGGGPGGMGGGGPPGGGMRPGGMTGGPPGGMQQAEPFETWITVVLAEGPAGAKR